MTACKGCVLLASVEDADYWRGVFADPVAHPHKNLERFLRASGYRISEMSIRRHRDHVALEAAA